MPLPYSKITQGLFTGPTGRAMGHRPAEVRELFTYFIVSPLRSNFGLYQVSLDDMVSHTGRTPEAIHDALLDLSQLEAVSYHKATTWLFVHEMAHIQYDTPCKPQDFKCETARKFYRSLPNGCPFLARWWDRYVGDFNLDDRGGHKRFGPGEEQTVVPTEGSDFDIADDFALVPQEEALLTRGPESAVTEIIRRHSERYAREFPGRKYNVTQGKDGKILKDLIAVHGADVVDAMDQELFNRHRAGVDQLVARSACDIGALQYHFNRLQQPPPRPLSATTAQNVDTVNRFVERARRDEKHPSD